MALTAPASIPALVLQRAAAQPAATILRKKDRGIWKAVRWSELAGRIRHAGMGLKSIGFAPGDTAGVLAETRPEWAAADLAILGAGGVSLGIPPDTAPEDTADLVRDTGCRVLFVENEEQLDKALAARPRCPALRHIVILDMAGLRDFADRACESFAALLARGAEQDARDGRAWESGVAAIAGEHPALLHPAGNDARPLTHGDVLRRISGMVARLGLRAGDERLALLPMADPLERICGLYCALDAGVVSNYLENAETLIENLQEVQPTVLGADAAVWARLHDRATRAASGATPVQRAIYRCAIGAGRRGGAPAALARVLALQAVRRELGLARLRLAYVGAGGVSPDIAAWAAALGIDIVRIEADAARAQAADRTHGAATVEA
jgi:long-chain acyl-CoA synthetase